MKEPSLTAQWKAARAALMLAGVVEVTMTYEGTDDSGDTLGPHFLDSAGLLVGAPPGSDVRILAALLTAYIPQGYGINEGGSGRVILDVAKGTIFHEFHERIMLTKIHRSRQRARAVQHEWEDLIDG